MTDTEEQDDNFILNPRDKMVIVLAIQLLERAMRAPFMTAAKMVSVAKALHVLSRLPLPSEEMLLRIDITGPTRSFEDRQIRHSWSVELDNSAIIISSGGYFARSSTGGDSFSCMRWTACPGCESDYSDYLASLHIVDDAKPFEDEVAELDFSQPGYSLDVIDENNTLLEEDATKEEETIGLSCNRNTVCNEENKASAIPHLDPDEYDERVCDGFAGLRQATSMHAKALALLVDNEATPACTIPDLDPADYDEKIIQGFHAFEAMLMQHSEVITDLLKRSLTITTVQDAKRREPQPGAISQLEIPDLDRTEYADAVADGFDAARRIFIEHQTIIDQLQRTGHQGQHVESQSLRTSATTCGESKSQITQPDNSALDPMSQQAKALLPAAQGLALSMLPAVQKRYPVLRNIDESLWVFVIAVAGVFIAARRLNDLMHGNEREDHLMYIVSKALDDWHSGAGKGFKDCDSFFEQENERLVACGHEAQHCASDAIGKWIFWNALEKPPKTREDATIVHALGSIVTHAFFTWWN